MNNNISWLLDLEKLIAARKLELPENSYTSSLFKSGSSRIAQKLGEEAVELAIAASTKASNIKAEAADLIYHFLVLLADQDLDLAAVIEVLKDRHKSTG